MTRQEVIFEQRLRLALTIVYFCLATANIVLILKERKEKKAASSQKPAEAPVDAVDEAQPAEPEQAAVQG
jgi:hypothetical protein